MTRLSSLMQHPYLMAIAFAIALLMGYNANAQVNAPAPATVGTMNPGTPDSNASRSNELAPDPFASQPKAPGMNYTNTQIAPLTTIKNYKMSREQCRNLSKAGMTQDEFASRSIYCDKHYAADTFDKNHPAEAEPASGM